MWKNGKENSISYEIYTKQVNIYKTITRVFMKAPVGAPPPEF